MKLCITLLASQSLGAIDIDFIVEEVYCDGDELCFKQKNCGKTSKISLDLILEYSITKGEVKNEN